jgi:hypothetical protein
VSAPRTIRDHLGEILRRWRFGEMRPLWPDMDDGRREEWRHQADHLMRLAEGAGLDITERKRG